MDSQNDITQPDNPLYWPKGAVKDLSQDEPKEKDDLDELELLQKNPLISNQIIHKRVPGKNLCSRVGIHGPNQSCKSIQKPLVVSGFFSGRSKNL